MSYNPVIFLCKYNCITVILCKVKFDIYMYIYLKSGLRLIFNFIHYYNYIYIYTLLYLRLK